MFNVVLLNPEIPGNTGNVIRMCANSGATLHLVQPLGFTIEAAAVRRAGLDYHWMAAVQTHASFEECRWALRSQRWFAIETGGGRRYDEVSWQRGDVLLFGCETKGLDAAVLQTIDPGNIVSIPMRVGNRSLNLSNAVAVVVYEAWRQCHFADLA